MVQFRKRLFLILLMILGMLLTQCSSRTVSPAPSDALSMSKEEKQIAKKAVSAYNSGGFQPAMELLDELKKSNPEAASRMQQILEYWDMVNTDMFFNFDGLPDGMETSDKLCLVVLGFQLKYDGSMQEELIHRLETALHCAKQYPASYILCTGGCTSSRSVGITEADAMADWLLAHGIEEWRIIRENQAMTTTENAIFSCRLLNEQYPRVNQLAIISSDYHIPWGIVLFQTEALLHGYPINAVSNAAFQTGSWLGQLGSCQTRGILDLIDAL